MASKGKIETKDEAIHRIMCEVMLFTDRPDYCMPKSVREAFHLLYPTKEDQARVYQQYGDWEEYDAEEDEEDR